MIAREANEGSVNISVCKSHSVSNKRLNFKTCKMYISSCWYSYISRGFGMAALDTQTFHIIYTLRSFLRYGFGVLGPVSVLGMPIVCFKIIGSF